MKLSKRWLYGSMGFLSLLGLIGIFTEERGFLAFFAFAVDFEFFFLPSDEMVDSYMTRSAARGFFCGMLSVAVVALAAFFWTGRDGGRPWRRPSPRGGRCLLWCTRCPPPTTASGRNGGWSRDQEQDQGAPGPL